MQYVIHQLFQVSLILKYSFYVNQYDNLHNRNTHYTWTAPEMWEQAELDMEEIFQKRLIGAAKITAEDHKGAYQCGKCRSWRTTYTQRQVRSSDEPMSVFCLCENCGNRWRF